MVGSSNQRLADFKVYNPHLTFLDGLPILKAKQSKKMPHQIDNAAYDYSLGDCGLCLTSLAKLSPSSY